MTTPLWCLVILLFFPEILAWIAGYYRQKAFGKIDNNHPRAQAALLEGPGARSVAAQANAWEALAMFTVAVVVVHFAGAGSSAAAANAAMLFVLVRVLHAVFYITDQASLRSLSFMLGFGCCIYLFYLAATL